MENLWENGPPSTWIIVPGWLPTSEQYHCIIDDKLVQDFSHKFFARLSIISIRYKG
jgi:hypothetical protein